MCFDNCSGHGDCIDYSCHCWIGYHGDDCSITFADESNIVPILTAGHYNLTRKNFTIATNKNSYVLVGFSSYNCHKCISVEQEYAKIAEKLLDLKVPFARADADIFKSVMTENNIPNLPALILYKKSKPVVYHGAHTAGAVVEYIRKQLGKPAYPLTRVKDVSGFIESHKGLAEQNGMSAVVVVGFFTEHEDIEEDEYSDFIDVAKTFQAREDVYFGVVTKADTSKWFKQNKTIDRTPACLLVAVDGAKHVVTLNEFYGGAETSLQQWVSVRSVPAVGLLTTTNFRLYEGIGVPMVLLFLDLRDADKATGGAVGGRSGGLLNEVLLDEFREVAKEHTGRLTFVYLDGVEHEEQMRSLGLYGGRERLPSIALNTKDGRQIPFHEDLPINRDTIMQYCADYLSGKLKTKQDAAESAKRALQKVTLNKKNVAARKEPRQLPERKRGVSEQFGDGDVGDADIVVLTAAEVTDVAMDDEKDVLLLLHSDTCDKCFNFAVYYKRMAERFKAMAIPTLVVARMDCTEESPPAELNLLVGPLPLLLLFPASEKHRPWLFYSGVGKVQQMMKWVHRHVSLPFPLPDLPHLKESDRVLYKQQIREREEMLATKRQEEEQAAAEEEQRKTEFLSRQPRRSEVDPDGGSYSDDAADL